MVFIYSLIDPRDQETRYIGKTIDPDRRANDHLKYAENPQVPKDWWVRILIYKGLEPIFRILIEVPDDCWQNYEKGFIAHYRKIGCRLLNMTDGGDGSQGYRWTDEQKKRFSEGHCLTRWDNPNYVEPWQEAMRNRDLSYMKNPAYRERHSQIMKGLWADPDWRGMMQEIAKERGASEEYKAKISAASKANWEKDEFRQKVMAGLGKYWSDPINREKQSEATKAGMTPEVCARASKKARERWQDPEECRLASERQKAWLQTPEGQELSRRLSQEHSERMLSFWADPEWKAEQLRKREETCSQRDYTEANQRRSESSREMWTNPEFKERMSLVRQNQDIKRAAERLGIAASTVRWYCTEGRLGSKVDGRFVITDEQIEEFSKVKHGPGGTSEGARRRWADPAFRERERARRAAKKVSGSDRK